jgi:hypothetical protein
MRMVCTKPREMFPNMEARIEAQSRGIHVVARVLWLPREMGTRLACNNLLTVGDEISYKVEKQRGDDDRKPYTTALSPPPGRTSIIYEPTQVYIEE